MGERPSHPELLDYADGAVRRRRLEHEEDAPADHAVVDLSAVVGVGARTPAKVDPDNKLLWRYNRRRLEGEIDSRFDACRWPGC